jgi:hypothetical protein
MPKFAAKVDSNQADIVDGLRRVGAEVQPLHMVGKGCPDLLVGFRGQWYAAEIKDGSKPPSARRLTPEEIDWHAKFSRVAPVHVWESLEDALRVIGAAN